MLLYEGTIIYLDPYWKTFSLFLIFLLLQTLPWWTSRSNLNLQCLAENTSFFVKLLQQRHEAPGFQEAQFENQ